MRLAIIGAGNVGTALGIGWYRAGHQICFGVVDPSSDRHRRVLSAVAGATLASLDDAVRDAEVVVLAVPWGAVDDALAACGDLRGKLLLDATNPLQAGPEGLSLALGFETSGGEQVARRAPGASVFKTMNQVGYAVMSDTQGFGLPPLMFVAGDDAARKPIIMALVASLGFEALDAGPLRNARLLEPLAMLWIDQALNRGGSGSNAFGMLRRRSAS